MTFSYKESNQSAIINMNLKIHGGKTTYVITIVATTDKTRTATVPFN